MQESGVEISCDEERLEVSCWIWEAMLLNVKPEGNSHERVQNWKQRTDFQASTTRKYNTQQIYAVFTEVNPYLRTAWRLSRTWQNVSLEV